MTPSDELAATIRRVADRVGPSVVAVNRHGTGFVVGDNLVLTNAHNLRHEDAFLQFADGRRVEASLRGVDVDGDLAVLSAETDGTPAVSWSDQVPELGTVVVAVANPRGRALRATVGTISSVGQSFRGPRGRRIAGGFEHTAPLARGSSGGPLLDTAGAVVGVNTHRLEDGFYLAVPTDEDLRRRIDNLAAGESPVRRRLGAAIVPPRAARHLRAAAGLPEVDGLLVRGVEEDGAAARAGLRRGDVLVSAGGHPLTSIDDLYNVLDGDGTTLDFTVVRATEEMTVTVSFDS